MTPNLVTVFGGSGFIGRQVVRRLAALGCQVRVAGRDPETALPLKTAGDVGQIAPVQANIRHEKSVRAAIDGADAVVNLTGILYEGENQRFETVHAMGAKRIAEAAAAAGVASLVHMSALGISADEDAARYAQSKAAGEDAVRKAFPGAVIVRPSVVFGPQDDFFNRFAGMMQYAPVLPAIGGGEQKFQPVYVGDVAAAIVKGLTDPSTAGETYELGGPTVYSFRELMQLIMRELDTHVGFIPVPFEIAKVMAFFMQLLPVPPLTVDQVRLLQNDNICDGTLPGLTELGIEPTAAEAIIPSYLDIYRKGGRFSQPSRA